MRTADSGSKSSLFEPPTLGWSRRKGQRNAIDGLGSSLFSLGQGQALKLAIFDCFLHTSLIHLMNMKPKIFQQGV